MTILFVSPIHGEAELGKLFEVRVFVLINQHSLAREPRRNPTRPQIFGHAERTSYTVRHDCGTDLSMVCGKPRVVY